jgi:hypothetical protein
MPAILIFAVVDEFQVSRVDLIDGPNGMLAVHASFHRRRQALVRKLIDHWQSLQ